MYLKRYHEITISASSVWRILHRLDMGRLPASQRFQRHDRRWKRYEKQRPGRQVQIDVKFVEPLPASGKHGIKHGRQPGLTPIGRPQASEGVRVGTRDQARAEPSFSDRLARESRRGEPLTTTR